MTGQANTEAIKNKIATREVTQGVDIKTTADPYRTIQAHIQKLAPEISKALPRHMDNERFARITMTTIRLNPALLECDVPSFLGACMQAAQLGLEPNLLGSCYLIPRKNGKTGRMECVFQLGFKGMIDLASRSGDMKYIRAGEVRENDTFEYEFGSNEKMIHKPAHANRGEVVAYYAYAEMNNGGRPFEVMSVEDVNEIRDKHASFKDAQGKLQPTNVWKNHHGAMAKKTVIKQFLKYLPISIELGNQLATDERTFTDLDKSEYSVDENFIDITPVIEAGENEAIKES